MVLFYVDKPVHEAIGGAAFGPDHRSLYTTPVEPSSEFSNPDLSNLCAVNCLSVDSSDM